MPSAYQTEHPPELAATEQEAVNRVLTGTALAAHSDGETILVYVPPPPPAPPDGATTEMGVVQWAVKETDTDIALAAPPTTVVVGSVFLIDAEYMIVSGVSNPDNPNVTRAAYGSVAAAHAAGAAVSIWGTVTKAASASHPKATQKSAAEPREETKKETAQRERKEDQEEEEAEEQKKAKGHTAAKVKTAKKK